MSGQAREYNGHHCRTCWNVALWIGNDEGLYREAVSCLTRPLPFFGQNNPTSAANRFLFGQPCPVRGVRYEPRHTYTPDGYRYTFQAVRNAMTGLQADIAPTASETGGGTWVARSGAISRAESVRRWR